MEKEINKYKCLLADIQTKYNIIIYNCNFCERYEIGEDLEFINFCDNCKKECCNQHCKKIKERIYCIECLDK